MQCRGSLCSYYLIFLKYPLKMIFFLLNSIIFFIFYGIFENGVRVGGGGFA